MLYMVATPIGNLGDLSQRAIATLQSADYIACEDTRHSKILLDRIGVNAPVLSLHAHSGPARIKQIIGLLESNKTICYISDAGTPAISDPGGVLARAAHEHGVSVVPIPGPSAVLAALSVCGFRADQYLFLGFLPKKKGRQTLLHRLREQEMVTVLFESPLRIQKSIQELHAILGEDKLVCVCRELTKQFEEVWRGPLGEAGAKVWRPQGEYVIVIDGK